MQTIIFRICAIGTDTESLDYLRLISRGICSFEPVEAKNLPEVDRNQFEAVLIDLQGIDTWDMDAIHGFLTEGRIGSGTIFHSIPGALSGLASCLCLGNSVFLHKPADRMAVSEAILGLVSQSRRSRIPGISSSLFGLDQDFDPDEWKISGYKPVLFHGEPGAGMEELTRFLGGMSGKSMTCFDCRNDTLESLDYRPDGNSLVVFHFLDRLGESARSRLVEWWLSVLWRDSPCKCPAVIATAGGTRFVDAQPGSQLIRAMFRDMIFELLPLRSRWVEFHSICKTLFSRACRRIGKNIPVDFSGDAYLELGKHSWPGNLAELDVLVNKVVLACQTARASIDDLRKNAWSPDMKRYGKGV